MTNAERDSRKIGQFLVENDRLTHEQLLDALKLQVTNSNTPIGRILMQSFGVSRADVYSALGAARIPVEIGPLDDLPPWDMLLSDPGAVLGQRIRPKGWALITHSTECSKWIRFNGRLIPYFVVVTESSTSDPELATAIQDAAHKGYGPAARLIIKSKALISAMHEMVDGHSGISGAPGSTDSSYHIEFDEICYEAFRRGASDIHFSNQFGRAFVKFRVHGMLEHYSDMSVDSLTSLMASAYNTLTEQGSTKEGYLSGRCQDGVIERRFAEGLIRFRYSGMPLAPSGADHTLRIIPIGVSQRRKSMLDLGYSDDQCDSMDRAFGNSSGMILFAGTTGSGKSTTMANKLMEVAELHPGKKIRTIEEPVEYRIVGAYQTPVVRLKGDSSDFLTVMRAVLRADPDILGVGEIRDFDTAELTIHAVRSGHLCISSIHAESALGIYDRLAGMGVPRSDLASINLVAGFVYQALVPVLCENCKIPAKDACADTSKKAIFRRLQAVSEICDGDLNNVFFARPGGCEKCHHRGVVGRTVAAEFHRPTPAMLSHVAKQDAVGLWEMWRMESRGKPPDNMTGRTAMEHAIHKMFTGIIDPSHVEDKFKFLDDVPPPI